MCCGVGGLLGGWRVLWQGVPFFDHGLVVDGFVAGDAVSAFGAFGPAVGLGEDFGVAVAALADDWADFDAAASAADYGLGCVGVAWGVVMGFCHGGV